MNNVVMNKYLTEKRGIMDTSKRVCCYTEEEKNKRIPLPDYTLGEELINAISHGIGAGLSIAALVLCVVKAAGNGSPMAVVSAALYGSMLFILYMMSTMYQKKQRKAGIQGI